MLRNTTKYSHEVAPIPKRQMGEWQQLLRAAFFARWGSPYRRTDFFQDYVNHDPNYRLGSILGLYTDGRLVSTCQTFSRQLVIRGSIFNLDGLGNIATQPAEQGRGHGKALLRWFLEHKKPRSDLVMLFSSQGTIYKKLGWKSAVCWEYVVRKPILLSLLPQTKEVTVRPMQMHDLTAIGHLYSIFNRAEAHTHLVRSPKYWENWIYSFKLRVYGLQGWMVTARGKPIGYLFMRTKNGRMEIDEYAAGPAHYEQVFQAFLLLFRSSRAQLLTFKRTSPQLKKFFLRYSVQFEEVPISDGTSYTLILNPALRVHESNLGLWHVDHF